MKTKYKNTVKVSLLLLIAATLAFIFVQSMLPPEKSKEESDKVGDIIEEIIPPDTQAGDYVQNNIRKIAHFVEFFILGCEAALYGILFVRPLKWWTLSFPTALIVAFFDESIQMFTGRGPAISDVWIDFLGFLIAGAIFYTVAGITVLIYKKCKQK